LRYPDNSNNIPEVVQGMDDMGSDRLARLTRGGLLARNTVLHLLGQGIPLLVAILIIPRLLQGLGPDRFGILSLIWILNGYLGLFDLGLGRALTQMVSERLGGNRTDEIPGLIRTALVLILLSGLIGTVVMALLVSPLVQNVLKVPAALQGETRAAFYLVALSMPLVISIPALRGVLEAHQRFGLTSAVSTVLGVYAFLAPWLTLHFSHSLFLMTAILLLGRIFGWCVFLFFNHITVPNLAKPLNIVVGLIKPLCTFGGWMTLANIVGPFMVYLDRFLIGAMVSMAAVAFYTTPMQLMERSLIVPAALIGVLFPAFSASFLQDRERSSRLFRLSLKLTFLAIFPVCLLISTFAREGLEFWLGAEFARNSYQVLQLLALGVFLNSFALTPFVLLQGAKRPDIISKLHLVELPFYIVVLWFLLKSYGIFGAALAWTLRVGLDAIGLLYLARCLLPPSGIFWRRLSFMVVASSCAMVLAPWVGSTLKAAYCLAALSLFALLFWFYFLAAEDRALLHQQLRNFRGLE
jgi:O-antigen/teichoic acid export membrane protein